jgi:hypothetical protein
VHGPNHVRQVAAREEHTHRAADRGAVLCVSDGVSALLNCCGRPRLGSAKEDLDHARGFEFMHATCMTCGAHWLEVFCTATGISDTERISDQQASMMLAAEPGPERKQIMAAWADEHL